MNIVSLSGNVVANAKVFNTKNSNKVVATLAVNRGNNKADYIGLEAWSRTPKSLNYLTNKLTKGNAIEVSGTINRQHFTDKNNHKITKTDVRVNSIMQLNSNNFNMNTATITGHLTANAQFHSFTKATKVTFTVASDDNNYTSFAPVEFWSSNPKVINFYKNNAVKGNVVEVINGHYNVDKYQDKNGIYQDYSDIASLNVELGYVTKAPNANYNHTNQSTGNYNNQYKQPASQHVQPHQNNQSTYNNPKTNDKKINISDDDMPF